MFHHVSRIGSAIAVVALTFATAACSTTTSGALTPNPGAASAARAAQSGGANAGGVNAGGANSGGSATGGSATGGSATGGGGGGGSSAGGVDGGFLVTGIISWTNSQGYYLPSDLYLINDVYYQGGNGGKPGTVSPRAGTCVQVGGSIISSVNVIEKMSVLSLSKCQ